MIHIFLGTKAQLIKMAPVMRSLQDRGIDYNFIFSGQHKETIEDIQSEFGVKKPDCTLYGGKDITGIGQMLLWSIRVIVYAFLNRDKVWRGDRSGIVLNHGDTFSTLLGVVMARLCGLKVAHVESGLRSFNLFHPFPEELIRRIVFRLSSVFFAPGQWAIDNLTKVKGVKVNTYSNTLLDSLRYSSNYKLDQGIDIPEEDFGIVSIHRFENIFIKKKLEKILDLIEMASKETKLLFILHKPTEKKLNEFGLFNKIMQNPNIELRPRYSYFQFIQFVKKSKFVMTDGGSNQEECFYLGKPCLILRKSTERQEGLDQNACLTNYKKEKVEHFLLNIDQFRYKGMLEYSPTDVLVNHLLSMNASYRNV